MKKFKLFTLSLLTLSAIGVLASCGGNKQPPQKPDVYFRANARVIEENGKTRTVDFKNEECANVEIENKDNLQYGQDVVITITPKTFFTFREYDSEDPDWRPTGKGPVRPYVGLGNPHSLYSYPLQEDLAWKFEDKSTKLESGFYKEEYKITVHGDFFQKNIVIDYGNVNANDAVYAYTSSVYTEAFNNVSSLEKSFGCDASGENNFYVLDKSYSAFTAAGKGVTVTYTFAHENPFTFVGWDQPGTSIPGTQFKKYDHFEVLGIKEGEQPVTLSLFDNSKTEKEQLFIPSVSKDEKYISFFIGWSLLANDATDDYSTKFDRIEVNLTEPIAGYECDLNSDDPSITKFKGGFFQYPSSAPNDEKPINDRIFETYIESGAKKAYKFTNVLDIEDLGDSHVQYGIAFQLSTEEERDAKFFSIYLDGQVENPLFNINLETPAQCVPNMQTTDWRVTDSKISNALKETELKYWVSNNGWHLVQLNPQERTFGFYDASGQPTEVFNGKENLYYLYTTDINALTLSGDNYTHLRIKLNTPPEPPVDVTFNLDNASQEFGAFNAGGRYTTIIPVSGDVAIPFYPEDQYINSEFDVVLDDYSVFSDAHYVHDQSSPFGYINLIRGEGEITEGTEITITLTQPDSYVTFVGQTNTLGNFVGINRTTGDNYDLEDTHTLDASEIESISDNELIFRVYIKTNYSGLVFAYDESEEVFHVSEDLVTLVTYRGTPLDESQVKLELDENVTDALRITVMLSDTPALKGAKIEVSLSFMAIEPYSEAGFEGEIDTMERHLGEYVGTTEEIKITFTFTGATPKNPLFTLDANFDSFDITPNQKDESVYELAITFNAVDFPEIHNGTIITLNISEGVKV